MTRHIITLPGHGLSTSAARRGKYWIKTLTSVDTTKANGFAFVGDFVSFDATVEANEGDWYLSYVEYRTATRLQDRTVTLYQVRGGELVEVDSWTLDDTYGWALRVRDPIAAYLTTPDTDALLAEREQLLARLAEIDALLSGSGSAAAGIRQAA